jgi:DNA-binding MarR family transcriptional regulator
MKKDKAGLDEETAPKPSRSSAGFLLAQVGAHAAARFGQRLAELNLIPPLAGILRILSATPAVTQQSLAVRLRMAPSRLVALADELEARGLIERREHPEDRRRYALHLTESGRSVLGSIGRIAEEHQRVLLAALSEGEQRELASLLQRIADEQGLARDVHPGFARLGDPAEER